MGARRDGRDLLTGAGRAFGGALLFATPIFMTMEVWRLGLTIARYRLVLLVLVAVVLVVLLSRFFGAGSPGRGWRDVLTDAGTAFVMASIAATLILTLLAVVHPLAQVRDAVSVIAIEMLPAAVGASYARSQLGEGSRSAGTGTYHDELLLMAAGAVVFAANVAPTEEVVLLAAKAGALHLAGVVLVSVLLMHGFVYTFGFKGQETGDGGFLGSFLAFTLVGYGIALILAAYVLWTVGRFDGLSPAVALNQSVVLALPGSLGAAAARLIL